MKYLRSAWYVAGFGEEVVDGSFLSRTLLDEPVVFFRTGTGQLAALADRCPHRFAPLSEGRLSPEGEIECPYHGLRFNWEGQCSFNPHGDGSIPKAATVKSYAVIERDGLIWWWAGPTGTADPSLIPDYAMVASAPPDATVKGYLPTASDYQLLVDNILDLTHADYLHAGSLGSGALTRTSPRVDEPSPRSVRISWLSSGDLAPPAFDMHLKRQGQPTDQWTRVTWTAPSNMLLQVGATLVGEGEANGIDSFNLHLATPESNGATHYWYWSTRTFAVSPEANAVIKPLIQSAFTNEDKPMLEAQHQRIGAAEFWSLKPVLLPSDVGAVRVRRKLGSLMASEDLDQPDAM